MPTFNWLKNPFAGGYSSGDIASPLPNQRRWHEERHIGGSYRQVLAKGILPHVPQNAVVLGFCAFFRNALKQSSRPRTATGADFHISDILRRFQIQETFESQILERRTEERSTKSG
jgi:hypothetical protein